MLAEEVLAAGTECSGTFHLSFEAETHTEDRSSYGDAVNLDMVGLDSLCRRMSQYLGRRAVN